MDTPKEEQPAPLRGKNIRTSPQLALAPAIPDPRDAPCKNHDHCPGVPTLKRNGKMVPIQDEAKKHVKHHPTGSDTTAPASADILHRNNDYFGFPSQQSSGAEPSRATAPDPNENESKSFPSEHEKSTQPFKTSGRSKPGPVLGREKQLQRPFIADKDGATEGVEEEEEDEHNMEPKLVVAAQVVSAEDVELNLDDTNIETKIQQEVETRLKMQNQNLVVVDAVVAIKPSEGTDGTLNASNGTNEQKIFGLTREGWCCFLSIFLLIVGIVVGVVLSGQDSADSVDLRNEITQRYEDANPFDNSTSPQSLALEWLLKDPVTKSEGRLTSKVLERYALAVFYFSTDGSKWTRDQPFISEFLSEMDACSWNIGFDPYLGAYCENTQSVVMIRGDEAGLVGTIPSELSFLSALEFLHLGGNTLTGTLPTELGILPALQWCSFASNFLTGTLPTEFGVLTKMAELNASECNLIGTLPTELGLLTALTALDITGNMFSGTIPTEFGTLKALVEFTASRNNFFGMLPTELGQWTALTFLDVSNNSLNGTLSTSIGRWKNLATFKAIGNNFVGSLPTEIGQWTSLQLFSLQENGITGILPTELGAWKVLEEFSASYNSLDGQMITQLGNLSALRSFEVARNSFEGILPTELGLLTSLTILDVGFNILNGTLPTELGRLRALQFLYLNSNSLSATLPTEIGRLSALVHLDIAVNALTGTLPTELSQLSALADFSFHSNNFTGPVGDVLCVASRQWDVLEGDCGGAAKVEGECSCCTNC